MKSNFRQSMTWLHTWSGLSLSWLLYFMFITGTLGYFNTEIDRWMQPEIPFVSDTNQQQMLALAEHRLTTVAADASSWYINFPIGHYPYLMIEWLPPGADDDGWQQEILNPDNGQTIQARDTGGGQVLYQMHYALHYMPSWLGYWVTSLASMFMLLALITGIIIHKKIFKDFFTFRPGKNQRSWLDMHSLLSVLPLPFYLMITYSGLILLMFDTMPAQISASYGPSETGHERFYDQIFPVHAHRQATGIASPGIALVKVLADAEQRWGKDNTSYIGIENLGDKHADIEIYPAGYDGLNEGVGLNYDGVTGELLQQDQVTKAAPVAFYDLMASLHEGLFATINLRWLYFLSGLMGTAMVATGAILWTVKRRQKAAKSCQPSKGLLIAERINVGTILGLPIAIAVYFWANRLIPAQLDHRADWEMHCLFISWAIALIYPFFRESATAQCNRSWVELSALAALLYGLLPGLNALTTEQHLANTLAQGDWVIAGLDLTSLAIGLCFGLMALVLTKRWQDKPHSTVALPAAGDLSQTKGAVS